MRPQQRLIKCQTTTHASKPRHHRSRGGGPDEPNAPIPTTSSGCRRTSSVWLPEATGRSRISLNDRPGRSRATCRPAIGYQRRRFETSSRDVASGSPDPTASGSARRRAHTEGHPHAEPRRAVSSFLSAPGLMSVYAAAPRMGSAVFLPPRPARNTRMITHSSSSRQQPSEFSTERTSPSHRNERHRRLRPHRFLDRVSEVSIPPRGSYSDDTSETPTQGSSHRGSSTRPLRRLGRWSILSRPAHERRPASSHGRG